MPLGQVYHRNVMTMIATGDMATNQPITSAHTGSPLDVRGSYWMPLKTITA